MDFGASSADVPLAIIKGLCGLIVVLGPFLVRAQNQAKQATKRMQDVPPSTPPESLQAGHWQKEITGNMASLASSTQSVVDVMRDELKREREEKQQIAADARRTANELQIALRDLNSAQVKVASLERVSAEWRSRAAELEAKVERLEAQQRTDRVDPDIVITPLRPKPLRPGGVK